MPGKKSPERRKPPHAAPASRPWHGKRQRGGNASRHGAHVRGAMVGRQAYAGPARENPGIPHVRNGGIRTPGTTCSARAERGHAHVRRQARDAGGQNAPALPAAEGRAGFPLHVRHGGRRIHLIIYVEGRRRDGEKRSPGSRQGFSGRQGASSYEKNHSITCIAFRPHGPICALPAAGPPPPGRAMATSRRGPRPQAQSS